MKADRPVMVLVEWEDATLLDDGPWADNEQPVYQPKLFASVGFLLYDGPEGVILTDTWGSDQVAARDQIVRGMIRSIKQLTCKRVRS